MYLFIYICILLKFYFDPYGSFFFFYFHNIWGRGHNYKILLIGHIWPAAALIKMLHDLLLKKYRCILVQHTFYQLQFWRCRINILYSAANIHISKKIFRRMWKTKQLLVHIDFSRREHCGPVTVWFSTFFQIAFMFSRRRKLRFKTTFE